MNTPESPNGRTYFKNLDSTRFLGFLHVFLAHCFFTGSEEIKSSTAFQIASFNLKAGFLGLDYFFVLSAFLLTWLALEEKANTGAFRPLNFMIRRGLRLWPLYFSLVFMVYLSRFFIPGISDLPPIRIFLLFYANLWMASNGQNFLFILVFFWSISLEEQFYLLWAFVMKYLVKYLPLVCFTMITVSVIFRSKNIENNHMLAFHSLSALGNFGIGALCAWASHTKKAFVSFIRNLPGWAIFTFYLLFLALTVFYFRIFHGQTATIIEKIVFSLFFGFIILEQNFSRKSLFKFGRSGIMSYLGQISLGLYCYHGLILTIIAPAFLSLGIANQPLQVFLINPLIILILTVSLAIISYELAEKKIHRLRRYFY